MSYDKGIGTCLVPLNGVPCGRQIEEGESIRNLALPYGGVIVGHKLCVDSYESAKREETDMVQRVDQSSPGGPVDMRQAKDALLGSVPLVPEEKTPPNPELIGSQTQTQSLGDTVMPPGVIPVSSVPFEEAPVTRDPRDDQSTPTPNVAGAGTAMLLLTLRVQALEDTLRAFMDAGSYLREQ